MKDASMEDQEKELQVQPRFQHILSLPFFTMPVNIGLVPAPKGHSLNPMSMDLSEYMATFLKIAITPPEKEIKMTTTENTQLAEPATNDWMEFEFISYRNRQGFLCSKEEAERSWAEPPPKFVHLLPRGAAFNAVMIR